MNENTTRWIADLQFEYDQDQGFLGLLRLGHFDSAARDRFLSLLSSIDPGAVEFIERRLVALLWYAPLLMEWQERRLDSQETEALHQAINAVTTELERILGVP